MIIVRVVILGPGLARPPIAARSTVVVVMRLVSVPFSEPAHIGPEAEFIVDVWDIGVSGRQIPALHALVLPPVPVGKGVDDACLAALVQVGRAVVVESETAAAHGWEARSIGLNGVVEAVACDVGVGVGFIGVVVIVRTSLVSGTPVLTLLAFTALATHTTTHAASVASATSSCAGGLVAMSITGLLPICVGTALTFTSIHITGKTTSTTATATLMWVALLEVSALGAMGQVRASVSPGLRRRYRACARQRDGQDGGGC